MCKVKYSFLYAIWLIILVGFNGCNDIERRSPCFWSMGSYPGWIQDEMPPESIDYTPWTHIFHFAMYPTAQGRLGLGEITEAQADAAVVEAHNAGLSIVLVVGGEDTGSEFVIATDDSHRAQFITDIIDRVNQHGYDGAIIDWEENVDGHEDQIIALTRELREAMDAVDPDLLLSMDVIVGLVAPWIVDTVEPELDSVNIMSYWDDGTDQVDAYIAAGVPASKIILGVGLSSDYADRTQAHVENKIAIVHDRGLRGIESWAFHDLDGWSDPRLVPMREAVSDARDRCGATQ